MRNFLECVTCCTAVSSTSISTEEPSSPATPTTEETRSLVGEVPTLSTRRRKKRTSVLNWKPSLHAISEDNAVSTTPKKVVNRKYSTPSPRNVKRCDPSSLQVNACSRSYEFGRDSLPMAFPTFAATPFMF